MWLNDKHDMPFLQPDTKLAEAGFQDAGCNTTIMLRNLSGSCLQ